MSVIKLGSLFGTPKTLASKPVAPQTATSKSKIFTPPTKPAYNPAKPFPVTWPKARTQGAKDYKVIKTADELRTYCLCCQKTKIAGFDYETSADDQHREEPKAALDPWKSEVCAFSLAAAPDEARAVFISHRSGMSNLFEPALTREAARRLALDIVEEMIFVNPDVMKVCANIAFETKFSAKYAKYILSPVADPITAWVRCLQIVAPDLIKDEKKPFRGWGLKPSIKHIFGVEMGDFLQLLAKHQAAFFDEVDANHVDALVYCCEDSDYVVQFYQYVVEIMEQIEGYYDWLHKIEMPFGRVIGIMEYWGMAWDKNLAGVKAEEALIMQQEAAEKIRQIIKEATGQDVNVGKSGKTKDVKDVIFKTMGLPVSKLTDKKQPALDEEALIDMAFMLEHNLETLDEEKYLVVPLPEGWEAIDPDKDYNIDKDIRGRVRIAKRESHPYKEPALEMITQLKNIQKYSTLLSSHIIGRGKYCKEESGGRIHAEYTPWTRTARLESHSPNGQNVPRMDNDTFGIRNFYYAPEVLFLIDFSGFELRIMAWKSGDEVMIKIFNTGGDIHRRTASIATGKPEAEVSKKERQDAKPANFGIAYGGTEHALQGTFKTDYLIRKTLDECLHLVNAVKTAYKRIPEFQRNIALEAREKGYVKTIYGFIRLLSNANSGNKFLRGQDERRAANTPIQGSAADIMKKAQNAVYDKTGLDTYKAQLIDKYGFQNEATAGIDENPILVHGHSDMIAQIHDEIIFQLDDKPEVVEAVCKWVKAKMEEPPLPDFPVPVEAEASCAYSWGRKISVAEWLEQKREGAK
ncbi:MAG: DNA polymerase [Carboxydocellales bacterium]